MAQYDPSDPYNQIMELRRDAYNLEEALKRKTEEIEGLVRDLENCRHDAAQDLESAKVKSVELRLFAIVTYENGRKTTLPLLLPTRAQQKAAPAEGDPT